MDVFISKRDFGEWMELTGTPDLRPGAIGQIAFVLSEATGRIEMVGCARWDDEHRVGAMRREEVLAHAERIKFICPEALPRIQYDFQRLQKAVRGDSYGALPWPSPVAPVGNLHLAAARSGLRLLLSRAISGNATEIRQEVGDVTEDQIRYTCATDFETFAEQQRRRSYDLGDSSLTDRKDTVLDFLLRPQMLDVWAAKVAPYVFEYAAGADAAKLRRKYALSPDELNRAFGRLYKIATGEEKLERAFTAWTPPASGALRNARLPQPVQERSAFFFPESAAFRRFTKMYGEDNGRVTAEIAEGVAPPRKVREDLDVALRLAELGGGAPEAVDLAMLQMNVFVKILGLGASPPTNDVSGYDHMAIDRKARSLTPESFAGWLQRTELTPREMARLARLVPEAVEGFIAGSRAGSSVMLRRLLLVLNALEELREEFAATLVPGKREAVNIVAELCRHTVKVGASRAEALDMLRDGVWGNFLNSVGTARLADEEARLQLTGEGV